MTALANRYDFVLFFDVTGGNPDAASDSANARRIDPETGRGLVPDAAIKRELRNRVAEAGGNTAPHRIYFTEGAALREVREEAWKAAGLEPQKSGDYSGLPQEDGDVRRMIAWICANFWDIRAFGAVMSTEIDAGQVRGPVQLSLARSEEPIVAGEGAARFHVGGTGRAAAGEAIVPYGLYRVFGFINATLAERTKFSEEDLDLLWTAFRGMRGLDRPASGGIVAARRLIAFRHENAIGSLPAHHLFDRVTVARVRGGEAVPVGDPRSRDWPPTRVFSDYRIELDDIDLPPGISVHQPF